MQFDAAVSALLEAGADPNIPDSEGFTALRNAAEFGFVATAELLLSFGAVFDSKAVIAALRSRSYDIISLFFPCPPPAELPLVDDRDADGGEQFKESGNAAFRTGDLEQAVALYSDGISLDPLNSVLYSNRAQAYLQLAQPEAALADAAVARSIDSDNLKAFYREGRAQMALERYSEATAAFWQCMRHDAANKEAKTGFLQALARLGRQS